MTKKEKKKETCFMALQSLNSVPTALQVSKFVMMHINNHYFFFCEGKESGEEADISWNYFGT